jgi:hypothetical protein
MQHATALKLLQVGRHHADLTDKVACLMKPIRERLQQPCQILGTKPLAHQTTGACA